MSRTVKGTKGPGTELMGVRGGYYPLSWKRLIERQKRAMAKRELRKEER